VHRALLLIVLAACFENGVEPAETVESHVVHLEVPLVPAPKLDLLVVVDRSPAMAPHLENLATNLPRMIDAIDTYGALPSVHLGVVAADATALQTTEAIRGEFIVDTRLTDGNRLRNYEGALADVFPALVNPRADATGAVRPLEAMRSILTTHPTFRRRDAHLLVVFLVGTDDASGDPLSYARFLQDHAGQRVAVAAALPRDACGAAPNLERFLATFENHALARTSATSAVARPDGLATIHLRRRSVGPAELREHQDVTRGAAVLASTRRQRPRRARRAGDLRGRARLR
jgi:hypothetical protein